MFSSNQWLTLIAMASSTNHLAFDRFYDVASISIEEWPKLHAIRYFNNQHCSVEGTGRKNYLMKAKSTWHGLHQISSLELSVFVRWKGHPPVATSRTWRRTAASGQHVVDVACDVRNLVEDRVQFEGENDDEDKSIQVGFQSRKCLPLPRLQRAVVGPKSRSCAAWWTIWASGSRRTLWPRPPLTRHWRPLERWECGSR